jgi:hypothetical protein
MRATRFELHIVPMLRQIDRLHMQGIGGFDLWDYATISMPARATDILNYLQADAADVMPPESHGGPWPEEWIQLFQRWVDEGYPRLTMGTATLYSAVRNMSVVAVTAQGTLSDALRTVWLDRYFGPSDADIVLYEDAVESEGLAQTFPITEYFPTPAGTSTVSILDAAGIHTVSIS